MVIIPELETNFFIYACRLTYDPTFEYRYVGMSSTGKTRLNSHIRTASRVDDLAYHTPKYKWMRKHYFQITFDILEFFEDNSILATSEMKWILILKEQGHRLLNLTDGGEGTVGYTPNDTARAKMAAAKLGRQIPENVRVKMSEAALGKPKSEEHRQNISRGRKGIQFSESHRKNISEWHKGRALSEETKNKIREAQLGKEITEDGRKRLALGRHTRWHINRNIVSTTCEFCESGLS